MLAPISDGCQMQALKSNQVGYLTAPLVAPTAHVLLTPLWMILRGNPELAVMALAWQMIAWFLLSSLCLMTLTPVLWLVGVKAHKALMRTKPSLYFISLMLCCAMASWLLFVQVGDKFLTLMGAWMFSAFASIMIFGKFYVEVNEFFWNDE